MFNWKASGTKTLPLLQNEFKLIVIVCVENRPKAFMTTENEMVKLNSFSFDKMRDASKYQIRWNHSPCPFLFLFFVSLSLSHTYSLSACVKWWISNFNHIKLFLGVVFFDWFKWNVHVSLLRFHSLIFYSFSFLLSKDMFVSEKKGT